MDAVENIRLGGREFRPVVDATIEHDYWLMGLIRRAGISPNMKAGESPDAFATRITDETLTSGQAFSILSGFLMPAEKDVCDWTPDMAAETAAFLKRLRAPEDKATIKACTADLLSGFFASGLVALMTSLKSTSNEPGPSETESAASSGAS